MKNAIASSLLVSGFLVASAAFAGRMPKTDALKKEKACASGKFEHCATLRSGQKVDISRSDAGLHLQFQTANLIQRKGCSTDMDDQEEVLAKKLASDDAQADRQALVDVAFPNDAETMRRLGNHCIVRVNAYTRDEKEFPIQLKIGSNAYSSMACVQEKVSALVAKVLGPLRKDCLFSVPCSEVVRSGTLLVDWNANRKGMKLLEFPLPSLTAKQIASAKAGSKSDPERDFLREYVADQFCIDLK